MICPRCRHDNPDAARFCGQCGVSQEAGCPSRRPPNPLSNPIRHACGGAVAAAAVDVTWEPPRTYTPKHLADKILTSRSALEGERKQVTVLFVDVSGFTSLAERLDPEDVHAIMKRAFD